jgi:hypothetical protein
MAKIDPAYEEGQRKYWTRHDAHLWVRHDAWRFMPPGSPIYTGRDVVKYGEPNFGRPTEDELRRAQAEEEAFQCEVAELRAALGALKAEIPAGRQRQWREEKRLSDLRWQRFLQKVKAGFNPDQPRVPAGNPDGGQWTSEGGEGTSDGSAEAEGRVRLAGEIPTGEPPEVPKERPATIQERNRVARDISRSARLRGFFGLAGRALEWLKDYWPEIVADQDPPRTLEELQERALAPQKGYHVHHVVEQGPARDEGFPEDMIEARENRVLIPKYQHERISAWFSTNSEEFNGMSPRQYLRDKDWDERTRIGRQALYVFGVLKP